MTKMTKNKCECQNDETIKITQEQFELFQEECNYWLMVYGITDFKVEYHLIPLDDEYAGVCGNIEQRNYNIALSDEWEDEWPDITQKEKDKINAYQQKDIQKSDGKCQKAVPQLQFKKKKKDCKGNNLRKRGEMRKKKSHLKKVFTIFAIIAVAVTIDSLIQVIRGDYSQRNLIMLISGIVVSFIYYLFISKFTFRKIFREQTGF